MQKFAGIFSIISNRQTGSHRVQGRSEIGDQIVGMLESDRHADQALGDAGSLARRLRYARVRGRCRVADERLGAPQADRRLEEAKSIDQAKRIRPAAVELAEHHHLPVENLIGPDALRKLAWEPPSPISEASVDAFWAVEGVRPWQRELVVPVVTPLL